MCSISSILISSCRILTKWCWMSREQRTHPPGNISKWVILLICSGVCKIQKTSGLQAALHGLLSGAAEGSGVFEWARVSNDSDRPHVRICSPHNLLKDVYTTGTRSPTHQNVIIFNTQRYFTLIYDNTLWIAASILTEKRQSFKIEVLNS